MRTALTHFLLLVIIILGEDRIENIAPSVVMSLSVCRGNVFTSLFPRSRYLFFFIISAFSR
jgi:hypothetical protein